MHPRQPEVRVPGQQPTHLPTRIPAVAPVTPTVHVRPVLTLSDTTPVYAPELYHDE